MGMLGHHKQAPTFMRQLYAPPKEFVVEAQRMCISLTLITPRPWSIGSLICILCYFPRRRPPKCRSANA